MSYILPPSPITISFEEVNDSPAEKIGTESGLTATRILKCAWGDRLDLSRQLLGFAHESAGQIIFTEPHRYPHDTSIVALDISLSGFGATTASGDAEISAFLHAFLTVEYGPPLYELEGERTLTSESFEGVAEFITIPNRKLYWDAGGAPREILGADEAPGKLIKMINWVYTIHHIFSIDAGYWNEVGKVNTLAIASPLFGITFEPETLLYNPPQLARETTTKGVKAWSMTLRFTHKASGWNKSFKRGDAEPQPIFDEAGAVFRIYELGDITRLIEQTFED